MQNALNSKDVQKYHHKMDLRYQGPSQFESGSITMVETPHPYG